MTRRCTNPLEYRYDRSSPFRTLWSFYSGDHLRVVLSLVAFAVKHSPVWLYPVFFGEIVNGLEIGGDQGASKCLLWFILGGLVFAQNIPSHMAFAFMFNRAKRNMESRLRSSLIRRLQQLSIAFHDDAISGRLQAKVLRDVEAVERLSNQLVTGLFAGLMGLVVAVTITLVKDPVMVLFFLVTVPIIAVMRRFFLHPMRKRNREFRTNIEFMAGRVHEMIEMIPIARAHAVEAEEIRKMDGHLEDVRDRGYRLDLLNAIFGCTNWVIFNLVRLSCLGFTSYLALQGKMTIGDVVMYQGLFQVILMAVRHVLDMLPMIMTGFESIHSIGEVLQCPDIEQNEGKHWVSEVKGGFVFENVTFSYPGTTKPAVIDLNMEVRQGESVAFVGESGAGKTTIMSLIVGFHRATEGKILLDGVDMQELDLRSYRQHLAVVPQQTVLFSGSVRNNIAYGMRDITDKKIWESLELANAAEFVRELTDGLDTTIGANGAKLSGGQRQRLAIARAMIRDPKVIILDEATSSLDVYSEALVQEAIDRLIKDRTTFIVAHRLSTIRKCGRIVVMKNGRMIEVGTESELMAMNGEFSKLKGLQI